MEGYSELALDRVCALYGMGGVELILSHDGQGRPNLAPVAWNSPLDYEDGVKLLFVCDPGHKTMENIKAQGEFAIALPGCGQDAMVSAAGGISGRDSDKYKALGIEGLAIANGAMVVPKSCLAWAECRLIHAQREGSVDVVMGLVQRAYANEAAWHQRLLYLGDGRYFKAYF